MIPSSEIELINKILQGDDQALEVLIKQYLKPVYGFVYRYVPEVNEAEDLTQETFVRMWQHLKKFDQTRNFKTWLFTIAKNISLDWLKKKKTLPFSNFEDETGYNQITETLADDELLPDDLFDQNLTVTEINSAVTKLPAKYQIALQLRFQEQFSFQEIAKTLNEPLNTVKSRTRRALLALKEILINQPNAPK